IRFHETSSGKELRRLPWDLGGPRDLAISPDGRTLAVIAFDGAISLRDLHSGEELRRRAGSYFAVAFTPDGRLAAGDYVTGPRVWDRATAKQLAELQAVKEVFHLAASPDGRLLASTGNDNGLVLWDLATGRELSRLPVHRAGSAFAFSPDGKVLAAGGSLP